VQGEGHKGGGGKMGGTIGVGQDDAGDRSWGDACDRGVQLDLKR